MPVPTPFIVKDRPFILKQRFRGFTLVELMMVLTVALILGALAMPNMRNFAKNSRMTTQSNDLLADFNVARSEAIKRSDNVVICRSANAITATPPTCDTGGTLAWENGWLIFEDANNNKSFATADGDVLLRARGPISGGNTIRGNSANLADYLAYTKSGLTTLPIIAAGNVPHHFKICDDRGATKARAATLENTGRVRIVRGPTFSEGASTFALVCP